MKRWLQSKGKAGKMQYDDRRFSNKMVYVLVHFHIIHILAHVVLELPIRPQWSVWSCDRGHDSLSDPVHTR